MPEPTSTAAVLPPGPGTASNGAPAIAIPPALVPVPAPKPEPSTVPTIETISMPKDAFDERLSKAGEAAQRKFLKSLGFDKPEDLQTIIATARTLQDEKKTEKERLEGRIKELEPQAQRADSLGKLVESVVTTEFKKLDEKIQKAIDKVADGDSEKRWAQMQVLREAGLIGAAPAPVAAAPETAPKTTSPPGGPPPPPSDGASKFKQWKDLQAKSPSQAAIFFRLHRMAIEASRPADE